jgi:nitric oxide reductase subunit B
VFRSQRLALKYFAAAMTLFGIVVVAGLLTSIYYVQDGLLLNKLDFSVVKMLHIDTMIIWLLMGFIGSVYWFLPIELERETEGIKLAETMFWIFCAAVAVVAAVFVFVQYGPATEMSLWFINQGRKYVEAPRWAAIGITLVVLVFVYNVVSTAIKAKKITGIIGVLMADLIPLFGLYLIAFPSITNLSEDQYWWWWLVHLCARRR